MEFVIGKAANEPAALIKDSAQSEAAAKFYDFLQTDYAKGVFEKYGFTVL